MQFKFSAIEHSVARALFSLIDRTVNLRSGRCSAQRGDGPTERQRPQMDIRRFFKPVRTRDTEDTAEEPAPPKRHKVRDSWDSVRNWDAPPAEPPPPCTAKRPWPDEETEHEAAQPRAIASAWVADGHRGARDADGSSSNYFGVRRAKSGRFECSFRDKDKATVWLGTFDTEVQAAEAYDTYMRERYGSDAHQASRANKTNFVRTLNFPTREEVQNEMSVDQIRDVAGAAMSKRTPIYIRYMGCMTTPWQRFDSSILFAKTIGVSNGAVSMALQRKTVHVHGWEVIDNLENATYTLPWLRRKRMTRVPDDILRINRDWLRSHLGADRDSRAWYALTQPIINKYMLGGVRSGRGGLEFVRTFFPEDAVGLLPWMFKSTPNDFWYDYNNRHTAALWFREQIGASDDITKWYAISQVAFKKHRLAGLLASAGRDKVRYYDYSPQRFIQVHFPDDYASLQPWKFTRVRNGSWQDPSFVRMAVEWVREELGICKPTDWYSRPPTVKFVRDNGLSTLFFRHDCGRHCNTVHTKGVISFIATFFPEDFKQLEVHRFSAAGHQFSHWDQVEFRNQAHAYARLHLGLDKDPARIYKVTMTELLSMQGFQGLLDRYRREGMGFHDILAYMFPVEYAGTEKSKFVRWYHQEQVTRTVEQHAAFELLGTEVTHIVELSDDELKLVGGARTRRLRFDIQARHRQSGRTIFVEVDGENHFQVVSWSLNDPDDEVKLHKRQILDSVKQKSALQQGLCVGRISFRHREHQPQKHANDLLLLIDKELTNTLPVDDARAFWLPADDEVYKMHGQL